MMPWGGSADACRFPEKGAMMPWGASANVSVPSKGCLRSAHKEVPESVLQLHTHIMGSPSTPPLYYDPLSSPHSWP